MRVGLALLLGLVIGCGGATAHDGHDGGGDGAAPGDGAVAPDGGGGPDGGTDGTIPTGDAGARPTLGGCAIFPADNWWNMEVTGLEVHSHSADYIANMGADTGLHPDFGTVWDGAPNGIPFVVVPQDQAMVPVSFTWDDESDPGPYPVPADAPIEGGPDGDGDRHVLVLRQGACVLYEIYNAWPDGSGGWTGDSGAVWHLDQNEIRTDGWTSADAAGLPILPGLVRYDEAVEKGAIDHAIRVTIDGAQAAYIHPATHSDGTQGSDPTAPPMGLRLRLKASFDVSGFSAPIQVILRAMQRYGVFIADTGSNWYVSGAPDSRWDDDMLRELGDVKGSDFEAVYTGEAQPY
jgi:hypothetical protein